MTAEHIKSSFFEVIQRIHFESNISTYTKNCKVTLLSKMTFPIKLQTIAQFQLYHLFQKYLKNLSISFWIII